MRLAQRFASPNACDPKARLRLPLSALVSSLTLWQLCAVPVVSAAGRWCPGHGWLVLSLALFCTYDTRLVSALLRVLRGFFDCLFVTVIRDRVLQYI